MMNRHTKHLLLYIVLLMLIHGFALAVFYFDFMGYRNEFLHFFFGERFLLHFLGLFPLMLMPMVFGFMSRSWRQFIIYLLVTFMAWQMSSVLCDWLVGRLNDPLWLKDKEGAWSIEILKRSIMPVVLISVSALVGQLKRTPRLP